jgi:hypothetical protein
MRPQEWLEYTVDVRARTRVHTMEFCVANPNSEPVRLYVETYGIYSGTVLGEYVTIPPTGGFTKYTTISCSTQLFSDIKRERQYVIRVTVMDPGRVNFDYMDFV